jgi:hypothetical protein
MFKTILALMASFALCIPVAAMAQMPAGVDIQKAMSEPALTEADLPLFKAYTAATVAAQADPAAMQGIYQKVADENGSNPTHVYYVATKISAILGIIANPAVKDQLSASLQGSLKPTDAEIELVSSNQASLLPQ